MKNKNKEQFKRLLHFLAAFIIIGCFTYMFSKVWNRQYNVAMKERFFYYGNVLMVLTYVFIYSVCTNSFGGFRVGYHKILNLYGSQVLGILLTNAITFIEISLVSHGRLPVEPMIKLSGLQIIIAAMWCFLFTKFFANIYPPRKLLIIYGNKSAKELAKKMSSRVDKYIINEAISCDEDIELIKQRILDHEAVIINDIPSEMKNQLIKFTFENNIRTYMNPKLSDIIVRSADTCDLFDTPLLLSRNDGMSADQAFLKRLIDIFLGTLFLIIASPVMIIVALLIKLCDGGSVLYEQDRLTENGKVFKVKKFRSMIVDAEKHGAILADKNDDRITPIGKFIRRTRFDELPQLFNVIKGDMSLVGPRPERPELAAKYEKKMPEFRFRLKVKAGLTGYAQVMGKYNTTPYDKLKFDLMYIENQSILLDLKLILMTVKIIFMPESTEGVDGDVIATERENHNTHSREEVENIIK